MVNAALISLGSISSQWTLEALKKYFENVEHLDLRHIEANLGSGGLQILHAGKPIKKYDCVYIKGSFRYQSLLMCIATALYGKSYTPIHPDSFTIGHDKLLTHLRLQQRNIPMPATYISSTPNAAKKLLASLHYPIIMKFPHGTQGKGVMYAESFASANSMMDALEALRQPFLIQEYIDAEGTDIRAIVAGEKVIASMKRVAGGGDLRANIHAGGKGVPCELDDRTQKIAIETAKACGAEVCAVDMLETYKGPVVIEVNLSPGLQGITAATKIDVADKIAKYLYARTTEIKNKEKQEDTTSILKDLSLVSSSSEHEQHIITGIDFRGNRMLLPELATKGTGFKEGQEFVVSFKKGKVTIERS
ncbi:RimK family alpha-L-glutamate ligase [Candidatus Woesearchaeota archaeon]|nr:RimK family alpha-L-glutamate ligase [Candidatus Woesearchaeota archaeon]